MNRHGQLSSGPRGLHLCKIFDLLCYVFYVVCMRKENAQTRLCLCTVSPESSLLPNAIIIKTLWTVSYSVYVLCNNYIYSPAHAKLEREIMTVRNWDRLLSEHALLDTKIFSRIKKAVKRFVN